MRGDEGDGQGRGGVGEGVGFSLLPPIPETPFGGEFLRGGQDLPDVLPGPAEGGDAVRGLGDGLVQD